MPSIPISKAVNCSHALKAVWHYQATHALDTVSIKTMMPVHIIYVSISKVHHPLEISVQLPDNLIGVPPPCHVTKVVADNVI